MTFEIVASIILGLLGIVAPIAWNRYSRARALEVRLLSSISVIERARSAASLELKIGGKEVDNLTKGDFALVNSGRGAVAGDDILSPLTLVFPKGSGILHAAVTGGIPDGLEAEASRVPNEDQVVVTFPLLNAGEVIRFCVYSTGEATTPRLVKARVRGISSIPLVDKSRERVAPPSSLGWTAYVVAAATLFLWIMTAVAWSETSLQLQGRERLAADAGFLNEMDEETLAEYVDTNMIFTAPNEQALLEAKLEAADSKESRERVFRAWIIRHTLGFGAATGVLIFTLVTALVGTAYVLARIVSRLKARRTTLASRVALGMA